MVFVLSLDNKIDHVIVSFLTKADNLFPLPVRDMIETDLMPNNGLL